MFRKLSCAAAIVLLGAACDDSGSTTGGGGGGAGGPVSTSVGGSGSGGGGTCPEPEPRAWYQFGMNDPVLDSIVLHYLGQAWHQSADVSEVLETAGRVNPSESGSWSREWRKTAERVGAAGEASAANGHALSASQSFLRAATYYRAALHHQDDPYAPEIPEMAAKEVESFERYLELSGSPCEAVDIPYEDTTLPAYFCRSAVAEGPAPLLLFQEGRDAWAEDG